MNKKPSASANTDVAPTRSDVDRKLVQGAEPSINHDGDFTYTSRLKREILKRAGEGLLHEGENVTHPVYHRGALFAKRMIDIVGSLFAIVALSPLWVGLIVIIKLTSKGPVFFVQDRVGQQGKWVRTLKFRTMILNADAKLQELLEADLELRLEYEQFHKLQNDPRITPIGNFLRRHSLDELPQFLNVLGGKMSLVGPRGYLPFEVMKMKDTERMLHVVQVKPGVTGFWQVGGRSNVPFDERLDMDVFYIQNWSLGMDFYLLVNTVWIVVFGRGAGAS